METFLLIDTLREVRREVSAIEYLLDAMAYMSRCENDFGGSAACEMMRDILFEDVKKISHIIKEYEKPEETNKK